MRPRFDWPAGRTGAEAGGPYGAHLRPPPETLRNTRGTAYISLDTNLNPFDQSNRGDLPAVNGAWLLGGEGAIPGQVAARLEGRQFGSMKEFRKAFWLEVANTPELYNQFDAGNQGLISQGKAPFAYPIDQVGGQKRLEIHHIDPVENGGAVFDMRNMLIVTPRRHHEIHYGGR